VSREHRTYARFYYAEFIRDYPHIYADDSAFASWVRLLATAEAMWPAPAELPRSVRTRTLAKLTSCGLVMTDGLTYRIKGMDAERNARSDAARNAAAVRWHAKGNAETMPSRAEPSQEARRDTSTVENGRRPILLVEPS
jgi:hypothetical protein